MSIIHASRLDTCVAATHEAAGCANRCMRAWMLCPGSLVKKPDADPRCRHPQPLPFCCSWSLHGLSDIIAVNMDTFQNYCIVCERLIPGPPEPETDKPVKTPSKKKAAGSIRVSRIEWVACAHFVRCAPLSDNPQIRNPDGTTTTRNANGVKTTRLAPRRPSSTKSQATSKSDTDVIRSDTLSVPTCESPSSENPAVQAFSSTIYCSQNCCDQDHGSSNQTYEDIVRAFGMGHPDVTGLRSMPPVGPPSPILGSDTDSSASVSGLLAPLSSTPMTTDTVFMDAASVPKGLGYYRMGRSQSDEWKELERKRRSSMNTAPITATSVHLNLQMSRQRSNASRSAVSATSSDSLSSLWQDQEMQRTMSLSGAVHSMAPIRSEGRHMSMSEAGNATSARPIARSNFSQSSLAGMTSPGGSSYVLPSQVGSAPSATAFLMHTYASAFPARDMTLSPSLRATPMPGSVTPDNRNPLVSPSNGTVRGSYTPIRSRKDSSSTWDAFGKAEVRERQRVARKYSNASDTDPLASSIPRDSIIDVRRASGLTNKDVTPTQSLEMENGGWQIRYGHRSDRRSRSSSRTRGNIPPPTARGTRASSIALPVPRAPKPASVHGCAISGSRPETPQSRLLRESRPLRPQSSNALPDLAALRIGASCAADAHVSTETVAGRSVPRAGFDWGTSEHKTYELPKGVVVNPNKGLFYFKA